MKKKAKAASRKKEYLRVPNTDLCDLAVDVWRLGKRLDKACTAMADEDRQSIKGALRRIGLFLENNAVETIDYTGEKVNKGLNIEILASEKNSMNAETVKETLEPSVLVGGKLIKRAKVIVYD